MKKHANISVFVPHLGCPQQCSFCNQRYIACTEKMPTKSDIDSAVEIAVNSKSYCKEKCELAFFGGSFTAIDKNYMLELLNAAYEHIKSGKISGIRISTRPDAINEEILILLKKYGVTAIELGAQSMDEQVLLLNERGHTAADVEKASRLIRENGFELGLQMMTGLYGYSDEKSLETAVKIAHLKPDTVRIYPTIVLENTRLEVLYKEGKYRPQDLDSAVTLTAKLLPFFRERGIAVIRTGLHTIDETKYVAGPWHPAFRELCDAKIYLEKAKSALKTKGDYNIYVKKGSLSKMGGQKNSNLKALSKLGFNCKIKECEEVQEYEIKIERVG